MTTAYDVDLFVIGAGSGGVRAARVAAQHGARVAIAEEHRIGGTCVIRGCVPKKMLVYGAHFADDLHDAAQFGWTVQDARFDWATLRDRVNADVDRLEGLYGQTLANNKVAIHRERATITGPNAVRLASGATVTARHILIATGAHPTPLDVPGADLAVTSNEMFYLDHLPRRALVAGGGYIANEFAGILNAFGVDVVLATRAERMLRGYDAEIVDRLMDANRAHGIDVRLHTRMQSIVRQPDGSLLVTAENGNQIEVDLVLAAIGRVPNSAGLGLAELGVATTVGGAIIVDQHNATSLPSIHAVGDVTDRVQLTPVAIREGHALADHLFGNRTRTIDYDAIPTAVFSSPPIAGVGLTEAEARLRYGDGAVRVYRADFRPMQAVLAGRADRCLYKMVTAGDDERVVGLHLLGPEVGEIIQAAAIAVKAGLTKQAFDDTVALHPSMAEELVLMK